MSEFVLVKRELLERWVDNTDFFEHLERHSMPEIAEAKEEDIRITDELRAVLAQEAGPVVERKEPVAWIIQWGSIIPGFQGHREVVLKVPDLISNSAVVTPLYTSPPAPVAVVLPTQKDFEQMVIARDGQIWVSVVGDHRDYNPDINLEYGLFLACLDKVKELNQ